jgi:hypothetical protein
MIRLEDLNCTFHAGTPNAKTVIRDLNLTVVPVNSSPSSAATVPARPRCST